MFRPPTISTRTNALCPYSSLFRSSTSAIIPVPAAEVRLGGFEAPVAVGWLGAMVVAGLIAWPIGKITLRFRSDYLAIATIGVAEIIRLVAKSEDWLTNSARGLTNLPRPFGDLTYLCRSEAHTSELQSLMRISYAVCCLKKTNTIITITQRQ